MIVVLGFFRSGTSALCRMLNHCGVDFGKGLMSPSKYNAHGYYENHLVNELNQAMGHGFHLTKPEPRPEIIETLSAVIRTRFTQEPYGIKDPRICRLVSTYVELLTDPTFILIERNEKATIKSFDDFTLNFYGERHARKLRAQYMDMAWNDTQGQRRVCVTYEELLNDWRNVAEQINETVSLSIGNDGGIDRGLNRYG